VRAFQSFVSSVEARDGGDEPEDVAGGALGGNDAASGVDEPMAARMTLWHSLQLTPMLMLMRCAVQAWKSC
jgi:hypothetical protein